MKRESSASVGERPLICEITSASILIFLAKRLRKKPWSSSSCVPSGSGWWHPSHWWETNMVNLFALHLAKRPSAFKIWCGRNLPVISSTWAAFTNHMGACCWCSEDHPSSAGQLEQEPMAVRWGLKSTAINTAAYLQSVSNANEEVWYQFVGKLCLKLINCLMLAIFHQMVQHPSHAMDQVWSCAHS